MFLIILNVTYSVESSLCHALQQGKFCYVLEKKATKALGIAEVRPSLCSRIQAEMLSRGYHSISIQMRSLTVRDPKAQPTWDQQFIQAIWRSLYPTNSTQLTRWLAATSEFSARERLIAFTGDLLFNEICDMPFVVFIEDIGTLSLPATEADAGASINEAAITADILCWIEYCYELRDTYLTYHHLSFAAFGSKPLDQIAPSISTVPYFKNVIETFQQSDGGSSDKDFNSCDRKDSQPRTSLSCPSHSKNLEHRDLEYRDLEYGDLGYHQPLNSAPAFQQSQYAKETAETQILAYRPDYDSSSCSPLDSRYSTGGYATW